MDLLFPVKAEVVVLLYFGLVILIWKSKASLGTTLMPLLGKQITIFYGGSLAFTAIRKLTEGMILGAFSLFYIVSSNSHGDAWEILMRYCQWMKNQGILFVHSSKWMVLEMLWIFVDSQT